jgi:hypothetical protein
VLGIAALLGSAVSSLILVLCGTSLTVAGLAIAAGFAAFLLLVSRRVTLLMRGPRSQCHMAIVPWGIVVYAEQVRVLRWSSIRSVHVSFVHGMDQATPFTRFSLVTVTTEREVFGGYASGGVSLERLELHLQAYSEQASRVPALDFAGTRALEVPLEPVCEQLIDEARWLVKSGRLDEHLALGTMGYRAGNDFSVPDEVRAELKRRLERDGDNPDPRALAAIVAAELELEELTDVIVSLTTSPNAVLAGVARAAALRLGSNVRRVGALEELADFLPNSDLETLQGFARSADLRSGRARISSNAA